MEQVEKNILIAKRVPPGDRFALVDDETNTIELVNIGDVKPEEMIETVCKSFVQWTDSIDEKDTNLLNLRDEMLGLFQKLKYLLTLNK